MKKIVALVLSLVMALSLCTVAFAAGYDTEITAKGQHDVVTKVKYVEQTDTVLGHYKGQNDELYVETADEDLIDAGTGIFCFQKDGKTVYLLNVLEENITANKASLVKEHKRVGCGDGNDMAVKNVYKDYDDIYWIKDEDNATDLVTVDGKYDNMIEVRLANVFGTDDFDPDATVEVIPAGHLMVLVKKNVEFKTSTDGKIVKDVNEYKCYFCNRTFYGSNYQYSTPESADIYDAVYARQLVTAGYVNVEDGVVLGDVAYYWTSDKDTGAATDTKKDGVDSAKTFDAGVAMYVGMSLLSVAGGAAVIGKKKEF